MSLLIRLRLVVSPLQLGFLGERGLLLVPPRQPRVFLFRLLTTSISTPFPCRRRQTVPP